MNDDPNLHHLTAVLDPQLNPCNYICVSEVLVLVLGPS